MPVLRSIKRARLAQERPRNNAPDLVFTIEYPARDFTNLVQPCERNHLFMRGDLKNGIGRRVNDGLVRVDVLFTQNFDDLSAGSRNVTEYSRHVSFAHEAIDNRSRKAVRVSREGAFENYPSHLPMTRCRVFAVRTQGTTAVRTDEIIHWRQLSQRTNIAESVTLQMRQTYGARCENVSKRVRPRVAPLGRVGHGADAGAVKHD